MSKKPQRPKVRVFLGSKEIAAMALIYSTEEFKDKTPSQVFKSALMVLATLIKQDKEKKDDNIR